MSKEFKAPRSVPEIQNDYQSLCTKAGHINYQIFTLNNDLKLLNENLRDLNLEAAAAQKAAFEAKEKADAEATRSEPAALAAVPSEVEDK